MEEQSNQIIIMFYKIINGLALVPFEGVLVEAYMENVMNIRVIIELFYFR